MNKLLKAFIATILIVGPSVATMRSSDQLDVSKYLHTISISKNQVENHKSDLPLLTLITEQHVTNIPYQNFDVFYGKEVPNISIKALEKKLLDEKRGGGCYETSTLLKAVLEYFGFDIKMIPAFPLNNKPFNPAIPSSHDILLVTLEEGSQFLLDVGYGNNSIRQPLPFMQKKTTEIELFPGERYQMLYNADHYQLNLMIKGEWASLYRFDSPLKFINQEIIESGFKQLAQLGEKLPILSTYVKTSILTPTGRIGFFVKPSEGISSAYKQSESDKKTYNTPEEFIKDIEELIKLKSPDGLLKDLLK